MINEKGAPADDPFLRNYNSTDLRVASEFLSNWLPFLSRDLCQHCTNTLSSRIRSLGTVETLNREKDLSAPSDNIDSNAVVDLDNCDTNSLGSWKDSAEILEVVGYTPNINLSESKKKGFVSSDSRHNLEVSRSRKVDSNGHAESAKVRMSWADMAQEDEFEAEENEDCRQVINGHSSALEAATPVKGHQKTELSRDQREYIRFSNVKRQKDFICLERIDGKLVNILEGLELHSGVFSAAEQKRIVDFIYQLQDDGKKGGLKDRTYTAPRKWKRGKGRVTIQFGCCYNYATDRHGNRPGILQNEIVDPIPPLLKVIIRRLVRWHVLPPSCVPDSCIVNIYDEGDCIPPHIDNHDFVRPFCTTSFLSECDIVFGSNLAIVGDGEFNGTFALPLPVGSVLVLNGNGADVAKHCVPAVPTKRISITFRKMDESKRPVGFVPEHDLQDLQPLFYENDKPISSNLLKYKSESTSNKKTNGREDSNRDRFSGKGILGTPVSHQVHRGPSNRRRG
ncbi:RNA demethylase ALKBH9B-like [Impatiens glandulifera]|uniref:RNA demethylase ALKBH9B-like n=1 Tax=Impatiens glandulifera TaxID=253017 RepID=UPI001FB13757|nr:RNA demethylase ALKBH9B-like [Impatiens glandulifera]